MEKGSETRSALLWEVQRILDELKAENNLPDVLMMENVDAICNKVNMPHYQKWISYLDSIGYSNYSQVLNSADYGIPQHRQRCFLISLYGDYNYKFPEPMELTSCLEDYFDEDMTDEEGLRMIVKNPKALDLLVDLDERNELE